MFSFFKQIGLTQLFWIDKTKKMTWKIISFPDISVSEIVKIDFFYIELDYISRFLHWINRYEL